MLLNLTLVLAVCIAPLASAVVTPPLPLQARDSDGTKHLLGKIADFGVTLTDYATAVPGWDGTVAGLDALTAKLGVVGAAMNDVSVNDLSRQTPSRWDLYRIQQAFHTVFTKEYDAAGEATAHLVLLAKPAGLNDKVHDAWFMLTLTIQFQMRGFLECRFDTTVRWTSIDSYADFVLTWQKYEGRINGTVTV